MTLPEALKQLTIGQAVANGTSTIAVTKGLPTAATTAALEQLRAAIADDARNSEAQLRLEVQRRVAAEEEVARLRAALLEAQDEAERRREANAALRAENTRLRQVDEERRRLLAGAARESLSARDETSPPASRPPPSAPPSSGGVGRQEAMAARSRFAQSVVAALQSGCDPTGRHFVLVLKQLFKAQGFARVMVTDGPGDGGVDLRLWDDRDTLTIVQAKCKSARYKVSETEMMAFDGALAREERRERGVRAIFVTSTGFVEGARERARPHGARLLLMGEPELRAALAEHDVSRALAADPDVLSLLRANRLSFAPPPDATPPPPLPPPPDAAATAVLAAATPPPPPPPPARQPSDASPARSGGTPGRQREAWTPEEDDALLRGVRRYADDKHRWVKILADAELAPALAARAARVAAGPVALKDRWRTLKEQMAASSQG